MIKGLAITRMPFTSASLLPIFVVGAYFLLFQTKLVSESSILGPDPSQTLKSHQMMQIPPNESFWQAVGGEIHLFGPDALNSWFQRLHFLVLEPPSSGGGAARKIDREKAVDPQNLSLWERIGVEIWPFLCLKAKTFLITRWG